MYTRVYSGRGIFWPVTPVCDYSISGNEFRGWRVSVQCPKHSSEGLYMTVLSTQNRLSTMIVNSTFLKCLWIA